MPAVLLAALCLMQDPAVSALPKMPPHPRSYGCAYAAKTPMLNGNADDPSWNAAPWSDPFVDIEGPQHKPQPWLKTHMRMLWDEKCLYIAAKMAEPNLWATLTQRDSVIFHDNDFEVFLDPDDDNHQYVELEMNALNTVWDLLLPKPYRDGGPAVDAFNIRGLKTSVKLQGKLNSPGQGKGWSVTVAIPWSAIKGLSSKPLPPAIGQRMRINFSRVEWDLEVVDGQFRKIAGKPEHNWVWSPQWAINMHRPETWGFLEFQKTAHPPKPDPYWRERCRLIDLYYRLRTLHDGGSPFPTKAPDWEGYYLAREGFWIASLTARDGAVLSIREDSRLTISK